MTWLQRELRLEPRPRGFHLITDEVERAVPELERFEVGMAHVFIRHTSASLTLNENASSDVRRDFSSWFDDAVPEDAPYWTHTTEGPDDMPAHIRSALTATQLAIPIVEGGLALGTWQAVYVFEHRAAGHARELVLHLIGA